MSGKRKKLLRKLFITVAPMARFNVYAWRRFKREYTRASKADRRMIMES